MDPQRLWRLGDLADLAAGAEVTTPSAPGRQRRDGTLLS